MTSLNVDEPQLRATAQGVELRHVRTREEFVACVELQFSTWGAAFSEAVPASMLRITQRLGGVTAGAFADDGTLLGFVFGITGLEHGEIVHWSDMLAVRDDAQGKGIGQRLKEFQRAALRASGVTRMYWTFDPLMARNAHFNLTRLGARVFEYVPDMYGTNTGSVLHSGFGTDRFIVTWPISAEASNANSNGAESREPAALSPMQDIPAINATIDGAVADPERFASSRPPRLRIEIPSDILLVNEKSPTHAKRWRETTRRAFQWALANHYQVERFERGDRAGISYYLLVRSTVDSTT